MTRGPKPRPLAERFWEKVDREGDPGGCWRWTASVDGYGYGQFNVGQWNCQPAHRVAYELAIGPIPAGLVIDHVFDRGCRRRDCCRPSHLEAVTRVENCRRGGGDWALARAGTCRNGHIRTEANTVRKKSGPRVGSVAYCRDCRGARCK